MNGAGEEGRGREGGETFLLLGGSGQKGAPALPTTRILPQGKAIAIKRFEEADENEYLRTDLEREGYIMWVLGLPLPTHVLGLLYYVIFYRTATSNW